MLLAAAPLAAIRPTMPWHVAWQCLMEVWQHPSQLMPCLLACMEWPCAYLIASCGRDAGLRLIQAYAGVMGGTNLVR